MFWTLAEQQAIKPLDNNNLKLFPQLQLEVEANDIVKYLGFEFYQELKRTPTDYTLLLSGGTYTWQTLEYSFNGLKYVFAFLLFARYIRQSYIQDTFSGFVVHTQENAQRLSAVEIANQESRMLEIAATEWDACTKYLQTLNIQWFRKSANINWYV